MAKITDAEFKDYLKEIREFIESDEIEIFGGDGYFEDSPYGPTERLYRDSRAMWLEEGTPTVQRTTIARELDNHHGEIGYLDW